MDSAVLVSDVSPFNQGNLSVLEWQGTVNKVYKGCLSPGPVVIQTVASTTTCGVSELSGNTSFVLVGSTRAVTGKLFIDRCGSIITQSALDGEGAGKRSARRAWNVV